MVPLPFLMFNLEVPSESTVGFLVAKITGPSQIGYRHPSAEKNTSFRLEGYRSIFQRVKTVTGTADLTAAKVWKREGVLPGVM